MKKLKLSLNLKKNAMSIKRKMNSIEQIMREIEANECNRLWTRNPIFVKLHTGNCQRLVRAKWKLKNYKSYEKA